MKCHALNCDKPALTGMPPCYDHWLMWPAKVRARSPWVVRPVLCQVDATYTPSAPQLGCAEQERGQLALFA